MANVYKVVSSEHGTVHAFVADTVRVYNGNSSNSDKYLMRIINGGVTLCKVDDMIMAHPHELKKYICETASYKDSPRIVE